MVPSLARSVTGKSFHLQIKFQCSNKEALPLLLSRQGWEGGRDLDSELAGTVHRCLACFRAFLAQSVASPQVQAAKDVIDLTWLILQVILSFF